MKTNGRHATMGKGKTAEICLLKRPDSMYIKQDNQIYTIHVLRLHKSSNGCINIQYAYIYIYIYTSKTHRK